MANIFDVAKYILNEIGEISTMKLQKLCYYSQVISFVMKSKPLFSEDFEAWANGPVCRSLFNIHKGKFSLQSRDIPNDLLTKLSVDEQALEQLVSRFEHYMANVASKGEQVHGLLVHVKGQLLFVFSCCWKPFLSADDFYRVESVAVGF